MSKLQEALNALRNPEQDISIESVVSDALGLNTNEDEHFDFDWHSTDFAMSLVNENLPGWAVNVGSNWSHLRGQGGRPYVAELHAPPFDAESQRLNYSEEGDTMGAALLTTYVAARLGQEDGDEPLLVPEVIIEPPSEPIEVASPAIQSRDELGDRMKSYEDVETDRRLGAPFRPVYARIDGRSFSRFTRGMEKPFDARFNAMINTTKFLVAHTGAKIGYTQSDEISLLWHVDGSNEVEQMFFNGKIQKLVSVLASMTTAKFTNEIMRSPDENFRECLDMMPHFDARVLELPSLEEAANMLLWRTFDANRNSLICAVAAYYSHAEMQNKSATELLDMLRAKTDPMAYPSEFRMGTMVRHVTVERELTDKEWLAVPEEKRPARDHLFTRGDIVSLNAFPFGRVTNRVEVIFEGAEPDFPA